MRGSFGKMKCCAIIFNCGQFSTYSEKTFGIWRISLEAMIPKEGLDSCHMMKLSHKATFRHRAEEIVQKIWLKTESEGTPPWRPNWKRAAWGYFVWSGSSDFSKNCKFTIQFCSDQALCIQNRNCTVMSNYHWRFFIAISFFHHQPSWWLLVSKEPIKTTRKTRGLWRP